MNKIKCDVCGKFIGYSDLESGKAICIMKYPESELTTETYETLCEEHNDLKQYAPLSNPELIEESRKKLIEELTKEKESILATNKRDTV